MHAARNSSDDRLNELTAQNAALKLHRPAEAEAESNSEAIVRSKAVGAREAEPKQMAFRSEAMTCLIEKAKRYAQSSAPILITGESGTGKEMLCRLIHRASPRSQRNFVAVNCAAMPELLIESELFGHDRGAFTGAFQQRLGHFHHADRGTLLLDEITEIPVGIQAKLLRVIEEQEVLRVGRSQSEKVDVRILTTSNRDLATEVVAGSFRSDLYYRVNVLRLEIPPLRQRRQDIQLLAEHFARLFQADMTCPIKGFTPAAINWMNGYEWPGNVRELRNVIQCACIESSSGWIDLGEMSTLQGATEVRQQTSLNLSAVEKELILASLKKHRGNKTAAAVELGVTPRTLNNKLKLYRQTAGCDR